MRRLRPACVALLAVLPAACGGDEVKRPIPQLVMLRDADRQVRFVGAGQDLTDVEFEAAIRSPVLACRYDDDAIDCLLTVNFVALRGPADDDRTARIVYFVGIADGTDRIVAREEFAVEVPFEGNQTTVSVVDEVEPRIPLEPGETGADYKVYLGLRLTPEELRYNQENR